MANVVARDVVPGWDLIRSFPGMAMYELRAVGSRYNIKWRGNCLPLRLSTDRDYWNRLADSWASVTIRSDERLKRAAIQAGSGEENWWRFVYNAVAEAMQ